MRYLLICLALWSSAAWAETTHCYWLRLVEFEVEKIPDLFGRPLQRTEVGFADQIGAAATLLMGQAAEGCPVVVVRGLPFIPNDNARAADVLRPKETDLFRQ